MNTLKEWIWLVLVACVFLAPSLSKADDIMECVSKGRLAASMVYTVAEGYELEKINVSFAYPPKTQKDSDERDIYVANLKKEVAVLLGGKKPALDKEFAAQIGLKVTEKCALEYGERSGKFKRTASSEGMIEGKMVREMECGKLLQDEEIITRYAMEGRTKNQIAGRAQNAPDISEERRESILKKIEEAFAYEGGPGAWWANAWNACVDGK